MKAELIAHFCLTYPAYRTARPGMLCRPTKVAAANCHALFPESSHLGDGTSIVRPLSLSVVRKFTTCGDQNVRLSRHIYKRARQEPCHSCSPIESPADRAFRGSNLDTAELNNEELHRN